MKLTSLVRASICPLLVSTALATPALGQEASIVPFPVRKYMDENGVDLLSGVYTVYSPGIRVGSADMGLTYIREVRANSFRDTMMGTIGISGSTYTVDIAGRSEAFTLSGSNFTPVEQNGSSLVLAGSTYIYTRADGTTATFDSATYTTGNASGISIATLTYPSGRSLSFHYTIASYTDSGGNLRTGRRLQSVTTNSGYHMKLSYRSDTIGVGPWSEVANVKGLNSSVDSCAVTAFSCPQTGRPELTIPPRTSTDSGPDGITTQTYVDNEGRTTTFTLTGGIILSRKVTGIRLPGSATDDISVVYSGSRVSSITRFGITTSYGFLDNGNIRTVTAWRPGGSTRVLTFDTAKSIMLSDQNELGRVTSYQYDSNNRLIRITHPEGNYTQLTYDGRGNVTERRDVAKAGSGLADIVSTATYSASCANGLTCNKPITTTDPRGASTDFTYDTAHGGLLTATAPATPLAGRRPEMRIGYTRLDSNGAPSGTGIFRITATSTCQTGTAPGCVGTADEVKTNIAYGQGLLPSIISQGAGDGSVTATSAMSYDVVGNLLTVDGPLAGTADTANFRYNQNRELIGTVGPDPDGAGPLKHRAQRVTVDGRGLTTNLEVGTVNSRSDADWAAFASHEDLQQVYDNNRRPTVQRLVSGGITQALAQSSYDSRGRTECVTTRMNSAVYGSLPASACTLGAQGAFGPDRITKLVYDDAGQVTQQQVALGTTAQATEASYTYTNNGRLQTLTDGEGNRTTFEYDGHDRLSKTFMPLAAKGSNASSATDYEQLTYDAAGNVLTRRLRDGNVLGMAYDNLSRMISLGGSTIGDRTFGYDLLGRMTAANYVSGGPSFSAGYDALGRNISQTGPFGTATSEYDPAGRRTRLVYPGSGLYIDYDYFVTGEVTAIRENGATSGIGVLASFAYDDLGRRTSRTYGNGVVTSYAFDPASRLTSLAHNLAGSTNDYSATLGYNPSSQISSVTRGSDIYGWTGAAFLNRNYVSNGLNQYASAGPVSFGYDARGNLISDGSIAFGYNGLNELIGVSGAKNAALGYDPLGRLYEVTSGPTTTRFAYDGLAAIAEFDGGNALLRRYVHGPGMDEPLVQYEGAGTGDRRFLAADERGSIVAVTDSAGNLFAANSYDEYGIPGGGNYGRFQYTGQMWLPEVGVYHYKARAYSPTLGRFLQTDPIGYAGGINIYFYASNDPVSRFDPLGLRDCGSGRVEVGGGITEDADGTIGIQPGVCVSLSWILPRNEKRIFYPGSGAHGEPLPPFTERRKQLSQCLVEFMNNKAPGYDWSNVSISDQPALIGSDASTGPNTIYSGAGYDSLEGTGYFFFHELGHMPQWKSGRLSLAKYFGEVMVTLFAYGHGLVSKIHDSLPIEVEAIQFGGRINNQYQSAGRPCHAR